MLQTLAWCVIAANVGWDFGSWACILYSLRMDELQQQQQQVLEQGVSAAAAAETTAQTTQTGEAEAGPGDSLLPRNARDVGAMHTAMWAFGADAANPAARSLMAWWVLTLGTMRVCALLSLCAYGWVAALSYAIEAFACACERTWGRMRVDRSGVVCAASVVCCGLTLAASTCAGS